jgi:type I restriction enzyme S subunit
LSVNKYTDNAIIKFGDIKYSKISEICVFLQKSKRKASYGSDKGKYSFYTSSIKTKYCDIADYCEESVIIGTGGVANIKFDTKFSCSADNYIMKSDTDEVDTKYVYYYLNNNIQLLENGFVGSTIKHISKKYIIDIEIPIPPIEKQKQIIKYCDDIIKAIKQQKKQIQLNIDLIKVIVNNNLN